MKPWDGILWRQHIKGKDAPHNPGLAEIGEINTRHTLILIAKPHSVHRKRKPN